MTLSDWFKTYLFNPLFKFFSLKWNSKKALPYQGALVFFITFFLMGIWHGSGLTFVLYGILLGFAVSINKIYQLKTVEFIGKKKYKQLKNKEWYQYICRGMALSFFMVALICLWDNATDIIKNSYNLGFLFVTATYITLSIGISLFSFLLDKIKGLSENLKIHSLTWAPYAMEGLKIIIIISGIAFESTKGNQFVYETF